MILTTNVSNKKVVGGITYFQNNFLMQTFEQYKNIMATEVIAIPKVNYNAGDVSAMDPSNIVQFNILSKIPSVVAGNGTSDNLFFSLDSSFLYSNPPFKSPIKQRSLILESNNFNNFTKRDFASGTDNIFELYILGADTYNDQWEPYFDFNICIILF